MHFWARPRTEAANFFPRLLALHKEHRAAGLRIVSVSVDRKKAEAAAFAKDLKIPWPMHFDPKGLVSDVIVDNGVIRIPSCFVFDRKGVLRATGPGDELAAVVKKLIAEPAPKPVAKLRAVKKLETKAPDSKAPVAP